MPSPTRTAATRTTIAELPTLIGRPLGSSDWRTVTQTEVDQFAALSGDDNPIHTDRDFAAATPFRQTIVHGYFTLSLVVPLMAEVIEVTDMATGINYGLDKLRFPAPVPVGARIRATSVLTRTTEIPGGVQGHFTTTIEVEHGAKPAAVAEMILRYYA